jgi:hypothetical protein
MIPQAATASNHYAAAKPEPQPGAEKERSLAPPAGPDRSRVDAVLTTQQPRMELEVPIPIAVDPTDRDTRIVSRETLHRFPVRRPAAEVDSKFEETGFREVEAVLLEFIQRFSIDIARPPPDYAVELSV